ncbi:hypothetical protein [Dyadobacter chenhuakuii]|uniref:WG repeat protein n=1 Tax=Dyadobacter chenhuakuii TaxID=2909339 RepID=A0A9X1QBX6_9BACT|nr:hypothetical protein [Dyadobacter chenhuakuii]MCF2497612.1 hypothetical protein [Dyadobacter chenhuakuii]
MERISKIAFLLAIVISSCKGKVDRNHLAFISSVEEIERNMLLLDSILIHFPEQKKNVIRSYYYDVNGADTMLSVNAEKVGEIHKVDISRISRELNLSTHHARQFVDASLLLLRNNVGHRLEDQCGWIYVYKLSNDRGEFRPLVYAHDSLYIDQLISGPCGYSIIDRFGKLVLFKTE